jgi:hypothetical protein
MTTQTPTIYGVTFSESDGSNEQVIECASRDEAGAVFAKVCESGDALLVSLVELEGAGPVRASDGTQIAPTHAPRCVVETWTAAGSDEKPTTAARVAAMFGNDGQQFSLADGRDVERVCRDLGARFPDAIFNRENGRVRYEFRDGSAIIVQSGYAWDLRHPKCTCGWCWDSNGAALPGCARAE